MSVLNMIGNIILLLIVIAAALLLFAACVFGLLIITHEIIGVVTKIINDIERLRKNR